VLPIPGETVIDWDVYDEKLVERLSGPVAQAIARSVKFVETSLSVTGLADLPLWQRLLVARIARLVEGVDENGRQIFRGWNSTLRNDVAAQLAKGYAAGEGAGDLALRMQKVLGVDPANPKRIGVRAEAIARTEAIGLSNDVAFRGMEASGVVDGKAWSAAGDARTRPSHAEAANRYGVNNPIPLNAKFNIGGTLMAHPHDPTAPAREVVQCRCRLIPVVKPESSE
jgi:uncharacterized protein with gpF-like domain